MTTTRTDSTTTKHCVTQTNRLIGIGELERLFHRGFSTSTIVELAEKNHLPKALDENGSWIANEAGELMFPPIVAEIADSADQQCCIMGEPYARLSDIAVSGAVVELLWHYQTLQAEMAERGETSEVIREKIRILEPLTESVGINEKDGTDFTNSNEHRLLNESMMEKGPAPSCGLHGKIGIYANHAPRSQGKFLSFRCPVCGTYDFSECISGIMVITHICGLHTAWGPMRKSESTIKDESLLEGYVCLGCGHWLENPDGTRVISDEELRAYLEALPVNQEHSGELPNRILYFRN